VSGLLKAAQRKQRNETSNVKAFCSRIETAINGSLPAIQVIMQRFSI
jgi:hypothetical protein